MFFIPGFEGNILCPLLTCNITCDIAVNASFSNQHYLRPAVKCSSSVSVVTSLNIDSAGTRDLNSPFFVFDFFNLKQKGYLLPTQ